MPSVYLNITISFLYYVLLNEKSLKQLLELKSPKI